MSGQPPYKAGERISAGALYRRIPNWLNYYIVGPPSRPTGLAFRPDSDEPYASMELASLTTVQETLKDYPGFGLCQVFIESFPSGVYATYEPEYGKAHVGVWGLDGSGKAAERLRRVISFAAEVIQPPELSP